MATRDEISATADALLEASRLVKAHGSADLQLAIHVALFILGREIAQREAQQRSEGGQPAKSGDPFAHIVGKRTD